MRWMLRLAVLLLVSGTLALAGPPTSQSSAQVTPSLTVTPDTGLVGGDVVTLAGTGFGANSTVYWCEGDLTEPFPTLSFCAGAAQAGSVTADATGAFSLPVPVYRFLTTVSGLVDCAQPAAPCAFGAAFFNGFALIGDVAPITFTPQPPAAWAIKGTVSGPGGQAVANASVWAYTFSDTWVGSVATTTDATGAYQLDIQPDTDYAVRFIRPAGTDLVNEWFNDKTHRRTADFVFYPGGLAHFNDTFFTADAQLAAGGAIAGHVRDSTGAGESGATVWAYGPGDTWVGSFGTTTGADGSYRIDGVQPADYKVRVMPPSTSGLAIEWYDNAALRADAKSVTVTEGSTATGIDAQLSPSS